MATDLPGILIVDDNEDNRYTLQLLLETDGHERITCAASGNEAIALIEKEKFSLVLLDLMMPDLNGDEVLKVIRSDPDKRDIPVVMISADTDADKVSQCIELGADDYLPKPFNPTILRARIGAALRRQSLRALESEYVGKIENEKRHSENLLRNILPAEIATRLRNGESNIADHFDDATVIFADVVGFGKITARMKAYEIVACLNQLFSEFDKLAEDAGIEKIKTIGDNYMAVSGAPTPRSNHARMAAKFALDMVAATGRYKVPVRMGRTTAVRAKTSSATGFRCLCSRKASRRRLGEKRSNSDEHHAQQDRREIGHQKQRHADGGHGQRTPQGRSGSPPMNRAAGQERSHD